MIWKGEMGTWVQEESYSQIDSAERKEGCESALLI